MTDQSLPQSVAGEPDESAKAKRAAALEAKEEALQARPARFDALGETQFKELPEELRQQLLEHWSLSGAVEQVKAAWRHCPLITDRFGSIGAPIHTLRALSQIGDAQGIKEAMALAREAANALPKKTHGSGKMHAELGGLAALALRRGFSKTAWALAVEAVSLEEAASYRNAELDTVRITILTEAARLDQTELAAFCMDKQPSLFSDVFSSSAYARDKSPPTLARGLLSQVIKVQEAAWPSASRLLDLARSTPKLLDSVSEEMQARLFFSASPLVREGALDALGEARLRAFLVKARAEGAGGLRILTDALACEGSRARALAVECLSMQGIDAKLQSERMSPCALAIRAIESGGASGLKEVLEKAESERPGLAPLLLSRATWIWNSETNKARRKKGDALAYCVAAGDIESARMILKMYPDTDRAYAKGAVKYLSELKEEGAGSGVALATWEGLLLEEAAASAPAPAKTARSRL